MASPPTTEAFDRTSVAPAPRTLIDILRDTAARHPEASALEDADGALSYAELLAQVWRTAARLHEHGVVRGDRVGVRMPSGDRALYVAILGILAAGAAYVPVDADDPQERADLVFGEARVRGVIGARGVFTPSAESAPSAGDAGALFAGDAPHPSSSATLIVPPPTVEDDAWIIFTSGSTGRAQGRRRLAPLGGGVRRRRGAALPARRAARPGRPRAGRTLGGVRRLVRGDVAGLAVRGVPRARAPRARPLR